MRAAVESIRLVTSGYLPSENRTGPAAGHPPHHLRRAHTGVHDMQKEIFAAALRIGLSVVACSVAARLLVVWYFR